jgi:rSAM/selenodomain-associated transferase 2/rSAM/selenodomain-associated transferase 1
VNAPFVSIIIPVLNDTEALVRLLPMLELNLDVEVIVVNGGDLDPRLTAVIDRRDVRLLSSPPGRGRQMNVGALGARGRWFLFLHADSRLPRQWLDEIRRADADPSVVGGSFRFQLDSDAWQARMIERGVRWRVRLLGLAYGDQALFARRDAFHALGGYPEWPLMEDVALIRRLRRVGRLYHSEVPVVTAARRWERDGWWRRSANNVVLQTLFLAGASPDWLARRYASGGRRPNREGLVVIARAPSDWRGKSRLTRDLPGDHLALRRAMLLDTLGVARRVSRADLFVAFEPTDARLEMEALAGHMARLFPQYGETLGDRMRNAFEQLLEKGYSSIVMVGSDLPTLPMSYIEQAFDSLHGRQHAVAIGPATDGGYYLIGLRASCRDLFDKIPWSTPEVLARTLTAAEELHLSVSLTPTWYDVDDIEDLRRVMREQDAGSRTREWIAAHAEISHLMNARG